MLPPELESIAYEITMRYRSFLEKGGDGVEVPDLLSTEAQVVTFVSKAARKSFDDLFSLACIKGWGELTQVRGISDGARHIRPRMEEAFDVGNFRFILDRPHCKEHPSSAGEALEPMTGVPAQEWADEALKQLETGDSAMVIAELKQAWEASGPDEESRNDTLRLEAGCFERNQDAVTYAYYRDKGWSTASSEVESGHRHVVQVRVKISGVWWHPDHRDEVRAFLAGLQLLLADLPTRRAPAVGPSHA